MKNGGLLVKEEKKSLHTLLCELFGKINSA